MAALVVLLAGAGYGLLELAFFAERNQLLPWDGSDFALGALFALMHAAVAFVAWLLARFAVRMAPWLGRSFPRFVPIAVLVAIHGASFFRERYYGLPRDVTGTLATFAIVAAPFLLAWILARVFAEPARGGRVAVVLAAAVVVWGAVRIATVESMGENETVLPRAASHRLEATDTGQRVFVLGFDGATWDVLDPLIAEGVMPNFAALIARGRTFDLETFRPTFSPVIWTSFATGKSRFRHGIHDVVQTRLPGGTWLHRSILRTAFFTKTTGVPFRWASRHRLLPLRPYRSGQVQATSVFEAASEAGLSATRLEWYVSWPATPLSGVNVSDRFHLLDPADPQLEGTVSPEALTPHLLPDIVPVSDIPLSRVLEFIDARGLDGDAAERWAEENAAFVEEMELNLARDLTTRNVTVDLLERDRDWRLFGTYFRAVDLTHHLTWSRRDRAGDPEQDPDIRFAPVIRRYYEFMDGVIGEVLAHVPEDAVVIMLSDHGFEDRFAHSRAPDGFAIAAGGAIAPSAERGRIGVYEIAPTVATLLGLPVAQDLDGKARRDLLDPAFVAGHPVREVSTWEREGRGDEGAGDASSVDDEELERLRALGYIQ
ncbi:MAG: alkaline phosphatase family protein [bacterium]